MTKAVPLVVAVALTFALSACNSAQTPTNDWGDSSMSQSSEDTNHPTDLGIPGEIPNEGY